MTFHRQLCAIAMVLFFSGQAVWVSADTTSDAEELFNWAESTYPDLFPAHRATLSSPPWLYRFYSDTDVYAGVNTDNHNVYVLGGPFGHENPTLIDTLPNLLAIARNEMPEGVLLSWPFKPFSVLPRIPRDYGCRGTSNLVKGARDDSCESVAQHYAGLNLAPATKDLYVYASGPGKIVFVKTDCKDSGDRGCNHGFGNTLIIRHNDKLYTMYAHLKNDSMRKAFCETSPNEDCIWKVNDNVESRHQKLGEMGQTGNVTGPHVHLYFEVKTHGGLGDSTGSNFVYTDTHPSNYGYLDPWEYLETSAFKPTPIKVTDASGLYVRRGPDALNHSAFMNLSPDQQFVAFSRHITEGTEGDVWYRIHLPCGNGHSCAGWIAGTVGATTFSELTTTANQVVVFGTNTEGLGVRASPGGRVINKVYDGQRFVFTETNSPGNACGSNWYRIDLPWVANTDEFSGWVCGDFLTIDVSATTTGKLNDTGITACSNNTANGLPCPVSGFPGQDAEHGRDALAAAGLLQKVGGGSAGFDFTKLDANGNPLPASATEWSCVKDNHTGLIWENKTTSGLRSMQHTYSWYNPNSDTNGGHPGVQNGGSCSGSSCDTHGYVQTINIQGLCGAHDWRMPEREELLSVVDYSRFNPSIDTAYFPHTPSDWFWSASPHAGALSDAWGVYFNFGNDNPYGKADSARPHVRLVRSGQ